MKQFKRIQDHAGDLLIPGVAYGWTGGNAAVGYSQHGATGKRFWLLETATGRRHYAPGPAGRDAIETALWSGQWREVAAYAFHCMGLALNAPTEPDALGVVYLP